MQCPCCNPDMSIDADALEVISVCRLIADRAVEGKYRGTLTVTLDAAGKTKDYLAAGNVHRFPYAAAEAAQRVAERFAWR